jgi:hypothetical protein
MSPNKTFRFPKSDRKSIYHLSKYQLLKEDPAQYFETSHLVIMHSVKTMHLMLSTIKKHTLILSYALNLESSEFMNTDTFY